MPKASDAERLRRAMQSSRDAFWEHVFADGSTWVSPGAWPLLGFDTRPGPISHAAVLDRLHPDDLARMRVLLAEALPRLGEFDFELRIRNARGQWHWLRGKGRVWPDTEGRPARVSGALTDINAERSALEALEATLRLAEQRRIEAERANAAKSRFLAHMSHEIRTPLNGVLGLTELALRVAESPEQRRFLETAHQSGQALLRMLNDVLDLSRIESGEVELKPRPFDPAQAMAEAMRTLMPLARARDLLMVFDWTGELPWVLGDDGALRQIAINLLGNAIKFTERGQVSLTLAAPVAEEGQVMLTIVVADTGPGVPPQRRADIFKAFVQGDDSLSRGHGGAGLGLAIASRLAEAMDGELRLDCPPEGGSIFTLAVPLPVAEPPAAEAFDPPPSPGRAWLVYQRRPGGRWLANNLRGMGWQAEVIYGLATAIERARASAGDPPDVVLVAEPALLPGADLAPLREALPRTPLRILIRPDWHAPEIAAQAAALRIQPVLAPVTPVRLRRIAIERDGPPPAPPDRPSPALPMHSRAEVLLVEDNPVNQLVGQEFLHALGLQVRLAEDGVAAVAACLERAPALVLMDLQMPGMDGLEATRQLRRLQRDGQWPGAPILALTANASAADRADCFAAGMDGVLVKPLALDALREQLASWLPPEVQASTVGAAQPTTEPTCASDKRRRTPPPAAPGP